MEIINGVVTFVVGLFAIGVYLATKRSEKKNAATIIVMDIRHAEQVVLTVLERGSVDKSLKVILSENNWAKYKHLFASSLSYDDYAAFNRFFDACVDMADARKRMWEIFNANLTAKASYSQQKILSIKNPLSPEGQMERQSAIEEINREAFVFEPQEPKDKVFQSLQLMGRLSNTVAFEKMKKIAGISA